MEEKKNRIRRMEGIYWAAAMVPFVISLACYSRMPEQVPTQWGWDGQVHGYSGRLMACFGIPAFMLAMEIFVAAAFKMDPKRKNIERSGALAWISRWFMAALGILAEIVIVLGGLGYEVDVGRIMSISIGLLITVMGNYLPRCRYNFTMGIRTPWTLNDAQNWTRIHRLAGYCWTPGGIVMAVLGYFRLAIPYFAVLVVITLVPAVYSYVLYRRKDGEGEHD